MPLRPKFPFAFSLVLLCASPAFAAPPVPLQGAQGVTPADVAADMDFLLQAWQSNALELAAARLALDRSRDVRVRQFAHDLVQGHSAANLKLQRIAAQRGLGIPAAVRGQQPAREFGLEGLRGADFDRRFVATAGIQAHREAIALYRRQAEHGRDATLVQMASDALPMLRMHRARADALQAQFELQRRNAPVAR
ncbi:MAG: DUF4142 domain-containing protein [Ramlibacter sp.]